MEAEVETKVIDHDSQVGAERPARAKGADLLSQHRQVGRYELVHRLGHGGMATVYLGRALGTAGFEKLVAVKVIHPHLAREPEFVEMFLDEARIASRLHHPHVVEILDLGRDEDDVFFMAMEYIEGETLASLLRQLRKADAALLPLAAVLQIMADACEGLAAAHELADPDGRPYELVHRDVSPHNLLVGMDGRVKVVDFGIMKAAGKRSNTLTGQLRGKLAYMSPEQAASEPLDHRSDIFALGAVLWEMCCGERLFAAQSEAETLAKVSRCEVPDLLARRPELPMALRDILDRALAVDREQRYDSARDMLKDVRALMRTLDDEDPRAALADVMKGFFSGRIEYIRATARSAGDGALAQRSSRDTPDVPRASASSASTLNGPRLRAEGGNTGTLTGTLSGASARQWSLWLLLPLLGAAIGTAAVSIHLGTNRGDETPAEAGPDEPITPAAIHDRPAIDQGVIAERDPTPEPAVVQWSFDTQPGDAIVSVDGERQHETTPLQLELPRGRDTVAVRIEKEGYIPIEMRLVPTRSDQFSYELEPLRKATNSSLHFTAKQRDPKPKKGEATETTAPPARESKTDSDDRTLPEMPDFRGAKTTAPGE
jgi:eukaryotic-like serine/threonine-protein kinase